MNTAAPARAPYPLWRRIVKIILWTAMAAVLFVAGTLLCTVSMLSPARLTPLVKRVANSALDADVDVSRVELGLRATFPFMTLRVDSLSVVSRDMRALPDSVRAALPSYADTLLCLRSFSGGINIASLAKGEINLSDIIVDAPTLNVVIAPDGTCNYRLMPPDSTAADTARADLPALSFTRFELREPRAVRYYDATAPSGPDSIIVRLQPASLVSEGAPAYTLSFGGNLHMPLLGEYNLWAMPFALDGGLRWDPAEPYRVRLEGFQASAAFLHSLFSADVDFSGEPVVRELDVRLDPVPLDTLLACMPDSMRRSMPVLTALRTDAAVALGMRLSQPFNLVSDTIPHADVDLSVEPCRVVMGRSRMHDVELRLHASLHGDDIAAAVLDIERVHVAGPATSLTLSGTVSDIGPDPYFDGRLEGFSALERLPEPLLKLVQGTMQGTLRADLRLCGRPSMFSRSSFHRLLARGTLKGENICWQASDTLRMAFADNAVFSFGTQERGNGKDGQHVDSVLQAKISVDSVSYSDTDVSLRSTGLRFGVGASNRRRSADTTAIIPMGGGISIASLRVRSIPDSMVVAARNVGGNVVMKRFDGHQRLPEFNLRLNAARLAAGTPDIRLVLGDASITADAHRLPPTGLQLRVKRTADSLRREYPALPADSIYAMALRLNRPRRSRAHSARPVDDREVIDWGTSRGIARLLTRWSFGGSLSAAKAGFYTPAFPLRNRMANFNLRFNNDSVCVDSVRYKVGRSDFNITGRITDIRRALTSRRGRRALRMDFDVSSDTIDVNQLAAATFAGAAYSQRRAAGAAGLNEMSDMSEQAVLSGGSDTVAADSVSGPLLIPTNIAAELRIRARNIIYSDLLLHDFSGSALMNSGHLNLRDLHASSDIGSVDLSALYSAPSVRSMQFGFGMVLKGFRVERFLRLVPAIDSIMPLMRDISGIIDANIAATVDVEPNMDLNLPTLNAAVRLEGDSLRLLDGATYKTMAKWLMFKNKNNNLIDSMSVEMLIDKGMMELFPFVFNFDRYRLGVHGYNDMLLNFDYHVAVLKSPLPFKFGITLKGNPDDFKVRLGKARFNERTAVERPAIVDTTRVNLLRQIEGIFRRGVAGSRIDPLKFGSRPVRRQFDIEADTVSHADSLLLKREGIL